MFDDADHVDAMCIFRLDGFLSLYSIYAFDFVKILAMFRLADADVQVASVVVSLVGVASLW